MTALRVPLGDGQMKVRVESQEVLTLVKKAIDEGIKQADQRGWIDFDDMLYLVASRGYAPSKQVDIVMADEGQDFNAAQIKVFQVLGKKNSQKVEAGRHARHSRRSISGHSRIRICSL